MGNVWPLLIAMALQTGFALNAPSATRYARGALGILTVALAAVLAVHGRPFSAIACLSGMTICLFVIQKATEPRTYSRSTMRFGAALIWIIALVGGFIVLSVMGLILQDQGTRGDMAFAVIAVGYGAFVVLLLYKTRSMMRRA